MYSPVSGFTYFETIYGNASSLFSSLIIGQVGLTEGAAGVTDSNCRTENTAI